MLKAQFEDADEMVEVEVDIRPSVCNEVDSSEYPTLAYSLVFTLKA